MADVRCPMCGKPNPEQLEECQFCGARLKPVIAPPPADSESIKPGQEPVKRNTSELEKVNLTRGAPIRPGEAPTRKNTAELERALPSWLRSLREGNRPEAGEPMAEPTADASAPAAPKAPPASDSSGGLPDWLSGLDKAASEDEEVPDWLAGLRGGKPVESAPVPAADEELTSGLNNADWTARLGGGNQEPAPEPPEGAKNPPPATPGQETTPESAGEDYSPDWLKDLQSSSSGGQKPPGSEPPAEPAGADYSPDWLKSMQSTPSGGQEPPKPEPPAEPAGADSLPDWLKSMQSPPSGAREPPAAAQGADNLPEWLSGLPGISAQSSPTPSEPVEPARADSMPDWVDQLKEKSNAPESDQPAGGAGPAPDWLSSFGSAPETPAPVMPAPATPTPAPGAAEPIPDWLASFGSAAATPAAATPAATPAENIPDWLSNLEEKSGSASGTPANVFHSEPQAASNPPADTPSWLSQLQSDVNAAQEAETHKDDFEVVPAAPVSKRETAPLPEWLSGIEPAVPFGSNTPALIGDNKDNPPGEQGETAFSMETPDWLSKLNPEQAAEKPAVSTEGQADSGSLEAAELPSWVQAMRPVESVVESKTALVDESRIAEISGPLAGLRGVLPSEPGLGQLRKPPAYSTKLQVSDGQHRYAVSLEKLIAGETDPHVSKTTHLPSNQLLRWLITVLLFLAVGLPLIGASTNGAQIAPPTTLESADKGAASQIIDGLSGNVPVLVAFDYDPALSGELEAVAAPVMDRLLSKGIPLALISTSPTGPILAEHFLQTTPLVKDYQYQNGNQYTNLGYLAGGSAGMVYFANSPTGAVTLGMDGQPAWGTPALQGIQKLSDFAAVIVLTDNADTGRNWIEQAGPHLGNTPMLMVISAQAEPMIRPYFDSGQLKGLVAGLSESKIYEQSNQNLGPTHQFGLDNQYWDSFSVGMLVAELFILAGVVLGVVTDWRARQKDSGEEA